MFGWKDVTLNEKLFSLSISFFCIFSFFRFFRLCAFLFASAAIMFWHFLVQKLYKLVTLTLPDLSWAEEDVVWTRLEAVSFEVFHCLCIFHKRNPPCVTHLLLGRGLAIPFWIVLPLLRMLRRATAVVRSLDQIPPSQVLQPLQHSWRTWSDPTWQRSPTRQKLNLRPTGFLNDWPGPPTWNMNLILLGLKETNTKIGILSSTFPRGRVTVLLTQSLLLLLPYVSPCVLACNARGRYIWPDQCPCPPSCKLPPPCRQRKGPLFLLVCSSLLVCLWSNPRRSACCGWSQRSWGSKHWHSIWRIRHSRRILSQICSLPGKQRFG